MIVYRVEHPSDGKGPYVGDVTVMVGDIPICWVHTDGSAHPGPRQEKWATKFGGEGGVYEFMVYHEALFGFNSLTSLRNWFRGTTRAVRAKGFVIRKYNVKRSQIRQGQKQLMFYGGKMIKELPF